MQPSNTLHPELLRSCASVLLHVDAYAPLAPDAGDDLLAVLLPSAEAITDGSGDDAHGLARRHCLALMSHVKKRSVGLRSVRVKDTVCRAILDATPGVLSWWCEILAAEVTP